MKKNIYRILAILLLQSIHYHMYAQNKEQSKAYYLSAKLEIENMLAGRQALSYERAVFLIENAWSDNQLSYQNFQQIIDKGIHCIGAIAAQSKISAPPPSIEPPSFWDALEAKNNSNKGYDKQLLLNYGIYRYMTELYITIEHDSIIYHMPYTYASADPLASIDWNNTQVSNLFNNGVGNCFALASLFKIFADRVQSNANLCTAPGHIYISHRNENGSMFNIETGTRNFPGTGTLTTLTHTTTKAIENNISLRQLNLRQSVGLCLVYLAKGYQHKFHENGASFVSECAALALQYDSLNLNALLLQEELEQQQFINNNRSMVQLQQDKSFQHYEKLISRLYTLGYREIPLEMKNLLIKGWTRDTLTQLASQNNQPVQANPTLTTPPIRYASLSWGLFPEQITDNPIERYSQTLYDSKYHKIIGFAPKQELYNLYDFDLVAFAMCIDPLAHKYPGISPYSAFAGNPIIFTDNSGAYVEGMDGKPVTYEMLKGRIVWSANASADTKRIGNAMIKTTTGNEQFAKMKNTEYGIGLHLNKPGDADFGKTDAAWGKDKDGKDVVQRVDVYVNVNSMKMWKNAADGFVKSNKLDVRKEMVTVTDREEKQFYQEYYLLEKGRLDDVIGAAASHEAEHATNPINLKADKENRDNSKSPQKGYIQQDVETAPNIIEAKDLNERVK